LSCISIGSAPGQRLTLGRTASNLFEVTGGDTTFIIPMTEDLLTMRVFDFRDFIDPPITKNEAIVKLNLGPAVNWDKRISGAQAIPFPGNSVRDTTTFAGGAQITVKRQPCILSSDTIVLSKPKFLGEWTTMYHLDPNEFWKFYGGKMLHFTWWLDDGGVQNAIRNRGGTNALLSSHQIWFASQQNGKITALGGWCRIPRNAWRWKLSLSEVIRMVERGIKFHVRVNPRPPREGDPSPIIVRTASDGTKFSVALVDPTNSPNSLLALPPIYW